MGNARENHTRGGGATAASGSRWAIRDVPIRRSYRNCAWLYELDLNYVRRTGNSSSFFPSIKKHMSTTRVRTYLQDNQLEYAWMKHHEDGHDDIPENKAYYVVCDCATTNVNVNLQKLWRCVVCHLEKNTNVHIFHLMIKSYSHLLSVPCQLLRV